ncbi:MAG: hypothetical protein ACFFCI_01025 [Promethearchaeota archaeon]
MSLQDLMNNAINEYFLGSYFLYYYVLLVGCVFLSGLLGFIFRKIKFWEPVPIFSAGNETNYFQERGFLETKKEYIVEWMVLGPTFFFGFFAIIGSIVNAFHKHLIDDPHLFYSWLFFLPCLGCLIYLEIILTLKTLPRYKTFISKQQSLLSYLKTTLEQPLKSLLTTKQTQYELDKLYSYNGRAKKILKKYLLELVDSI